MTSQQPANELPTVSFPPSVDHPELATGLGKTLRSRRQSSGLTLQQLADRCGLSQPFLSQLENGKAMPSLLALHHIAAALGTSAQALLQPMAPAETSLVRGDSKHSYELAPGVTVCFLVEGPDHNFEVNLVSAEPESASPCDLVHDGEEMAYVLEGSIEITLLDHDPVLLNCGDGYTYPADVPHSWRNIGSQRSRFLYITSPPSF